MAARVFLLILFGWLVGPTTTFAQEPGGQCLACHPSHYEELASCTYCHRGDDRTTRLSLAHRSLIPAKLSAFALPGDRKTEDGLRMLESLACRRCHIWDGKGSRLATDLGSVYYSEGVADLTDAFYEPVAYMPDFGLDEGQVEALVGALLKTSQVATAPATQFPVVVYFNPQPREQKHPFDTQCGGCHRLLSHRFGVLGNGDAAPNLSGLFGEYYPEVVQGVPWTSELLRRWLTNPRQLDKNSLMPPILLEGNELDEIIEVFCSSTAEFCVDQSLPVGNELPLQ